MKMKNESKILVFYVGVAGIPMEDISDYMERVATKITPQNFDGEVLFLPTLSSYDVRVECINPQYVTDTELIKKNHDLLNELRFELTNQLNNIKNSNNE
jgi:hypothetical protein